MRKTKKQPSADKIPFAAAWRLNKKGLAFWWRLSPQLMTANLLTALFGAIRPYVALWFSARLLDEIATARRPDMLTKLALAALLTVSALAAAHCVASRQCTRYTASVNWFGFKRRFAQKLSDMDFSRMDAPATHALYDSIMQADNWHSWGLRNLHYRLQDGFSGLFRVLGALALCVSQFASQVTAAGWGWLDSPLAGLGLLAALLGIILLAPYCARRSAAYSSRANEEATQTNRLFVAYGNPPAGTDRAMDIRIYRQQEFLPVKMETGCKMFNSRTGLLAAYSRGPMGAFEALSGAASCSFTLVAYLFVCLKAWAGAFGVGAVTQYVGAITGFAAGLSQLFTTAAKLQINLPYLQKALDFLELPNEMYQGSLNVEKRSDRNYDVEFRDVSFRYPGADAWALRHVSFKFRVGQRLAVVGENGSGKTTFIKLLCRLYDPTEGAILLNGIDIRKYNYDQYKAIFSVVFQDFQLLAQPLGQNVAANTRVDAARAVNCLRKAGLDSAWLDRQPHGLDTWLYRVFEKDGVEISGGEAQKIAIARALYKNAPFIVLDEPTAALDPVAEAEVYAGFDALIEDRTAIYISHRLSSCRFCDTITVFDAGQMVQSGTHEALVEAADGKYAQMWQAQAQYYV